MLPVTWVLIPAWTVSAFIRWELTRGPHSGVVLIRILLVSAFGNSNNQIDLMRGFVDFRLRLQLRFPQATICIKLCRLIHTRTNVSHAERLIRPKVELFPKGCSGYAQ